MFQYVTIGIRPWLYSSNIKRQQQKRIHFWFQSLFCREKKHKIPPEINYTPQKQARPQKKVVGRLFSFL